MAIFSNSAISSPATQHAGLEQRSGAGHRKRWHIPRPRRNRKTRKSRQSPDSYRRFFRNQRNIGRPWASRRGGNVAFWQRRDLRGTGKHHARIGGSGGNWAPTVSPRPKTATVARRPATRPLPAKWRTGGNRRHNSAVSPERCCLRVGAAAVGRWPAGEVHGLIRAAAVAGRCVSLSK